MRHVVLRWAGALAMVGLIVATSAHARAQATVDEMLGGLKSFGKAKQDRLAAGLVRRLAEQYPELEEKDQKKVVRGVTDCLSRRRKKDEVELHVAALEALAVMGPEGTKAALRVIKNKSLASRPPVLGAALVSLSRHGDPKHVKILIDHLDHQDFPVIAAAARALGNYADQPGKVRKPLVEALVEYYCRYEAEATNIYAQGGPERLEAVERPMLEALNRLTKTDTNTDAADWQRWWRANEKKDWDPPPKKDGGKGG